MNFRQFLDFFCVFPQKRLAYVNKNSKAIDNIAQELINYLSAFFIASFFAIAALALIPLSKM